MKILAGRERDIEDVVELVRFDRSAVDLARVRDVLGQIEAGIGEGGLLAALDVVERRLSPRPPAIGTRSSRRRK